MIEFIAKYWLEWGLGAVSGALLALWRSLMKLKKEKAEKDSAICDGLRAALHNMLYLGCYEALERGSIEPQERENLEMIYKAYHKLGGNGSGTALWERTMDLKIRDVR